MSKKDSKLNNLTMEAGEYPAGKPFYYCPTNSCGKCHGCTTSKKLDELIRPDLNDEEFEKHLVNERGNLYFTSRLQGEYYLSSGTDPLTQEEIDKINQQFWADYERIKERTPNTGWLMTLDDDGNPTCRTSDACGKCVKCQQQLRKLAREGENYMVAAGGFLPAGNGRHYRHAAIIKDAVERGLPITGTPDYHRSLHSPLPETLQFGRQLQRFNKVGITRRPMLPIGNNWLHKALITGGGFRHGELGIISAGAPDPLNRFKSNWLANYVSDFVARGPKPVDERSILQLFAEPEITGGDYYQRLRNLVNATRPVHMVRVPGGTRPEKIVKYIGATDHSSPPPSVQDLERFVDPSPFIEVKGWGIWVGGKKILGIPFTMQDMMIDSITARHRYRPIPGTFGALGQVTLEYPAHDYEYTPERISLVREDWAEDAIDKLVYLQLYGRAYGKDSNGNFLVPGRITHFGLQTAQYHKMQARERLRAASNPERQKRGY